MGRWNLKTDGLVIWKPLLVFAVYLIWTLMSGVLRGITSLRMVDGQVYASCPIFFRVQMVGSVFAALISAAQFESLFCRSSYSYLKTLPLNLWQLWGKRVLALGAVLFVLGLSVGAIGASQTNDGLADFSASFELGWSARVKWPMIVCCLVVPWWFSAMVSQLLFCVFKNRLMTVGLILVFHMLLYQGPMQRGLGVWSPLCWSTMPLVISNPFAPGLAVACAGIAAIAAGIGSYLTVTRCSRRQPVCP